MADYNLKAITADTDGPSADTELLFGAPDQSSGTPKPYSFAGVKTWVNGFNGRAVHPGYKAGNWYVPVSLSAQTASGATLVAGNIYLLPFFVPQKITLSDLAAVLITAIASSNIQLAIYNSNASDPTRPGTLVGATGSITSIAAGGKTATFAGAATFQLNVGWYFWAINSDISGLVFSSIGPNNLQTNQIMGTATLSNITSSTNSNLFQLSVVQAFSTWPDLTGATFVEAGPGAVRSPYPVFKVASVP